MHGIALSYYYFQSWLVLELSIAGKDALRRGVRSMMMGALYL